MESNLICKNHLKPVMQICVECKATMCAECIDSHNEKCQGRNSYIPAYASKTMLPKFEDLMNDLVTNKSEIEMSSEFLLSSIPKVKEGLMGLKKRLEQVISKISQIAENLREYKSEAKSLFERTKASILEEQMKLQEAIKEVNINFLIEKIRNGIAASIPIIGDNEKQLIKSISTSISSLIQEKQFDSLLNSLTSLVSVCQGLSKPTFEHVPVINKYIYGKCEAFESGTKLLKYDIAAKKVYPLVTLPGYRVVLQIGKRVFISGRTTLSEYVEDTQCLVVKAPMAYDRINYNMAAISSNSFASIGGYDGTSRALNYCEEYSIEKDKWTILPALNKVRYFCAVALLNNTDLYVFGGSKSDDTVERLNLKTKTLWVNCDLSVKEVNISSTPAAFAITSDEIMILIGAGTQDIAIYNIKAGTIMKHSATVKPDQYIFNTVSIIKGDAYIMGSHYGHIHHFKMKDRLFADIDFKQIYP